MLGAWCLLLDAWCLLAACCLMLEHLPDPSTKGGGLRPPPQRGGGLRPPPLCGILCGWVWQVFKHQAASSKQASGIKQQASSTKQQALRNWALRLWQEIKKSCFPDSQFLIRKFLLLWGGCIYFWCPSPRASQHIDPETTNKSNPQMSFSFLQWIFVPY